MEESKGKHNRVDQEQIVVIDLSDSDCEDVKVPIHVEVLPEAEVRIDSGVNPEIRFNTVNVDVTNENDISEMEGGQTIDNLIAKCEESVDFLIAKSKSEGFYDHSSFVNQN